MSKPYTGGCACGAVRYEIAAEPVFSNECHCLDCQKESGTGHGSHLTFLREFVKQNGDVKHWDMVADSGNVKTRSFCATCGSPVFLTFAAMPQFFSVRAASLDEPGRYQPQVVTYAVRAHAWDFVDPALARFDKMPV